jgi:hypothetical protein
MTDVPVKDANPLVSNLPGQHVLLVRALCEVCLAQSGQPSVSGVQQVDLRYVRDNLGHESISTTSQYLHADDDDRHRATGAGLRLDW